MFSPRSSLPRLTRPETRSVVSFPELELWFRDLAPLPPEIKLTAARPCFLRASRSTCQVATAQLAKVETVFNSPSATKANQKVRPSSFERKRLTVAFRVLRARYES